MNVIWHLYPEPNIDCVSSLVVLLCLSSGSHLLCALDSAARGRQGLKCHFMLGNKLSLHYPKPKPEMNFI